MRWIAQNFKSDAIALVTVRAIPLRAAPAYTGGGALPYAPKGQRLAMVQPSPRHSGEVEAQISNFRPAIDLAHGSGSVYA